MYNFSLRKAQGERVRIEHFGLIGRIIERSGPVVKTNNTFIIIVFIEL